VNPVESFFLQKNRTSAKGGNHPEKGFTMKTDMMPAATGTQDEKVNSFPY